MSEGKVSITPEMAIQCIKELLQENRDLKELYDYEHEELLDCHKNHVNSMQENHDLKVRLAFYENGTNPGSPTFDDLEKMDLVKQNRELREALEKISEPSACSKCEGDGHLWADGKAHFPDYKGETVRCGSCGGSGISNVDASEIAKSALAKSGDHRE